MGIFDRIRKIFSRSGSSRASRNRNTISYGQFDNQAWRSYLDKQNRNLNVPANSQRSSRSNVSEGPLVTAHCRSGMTSVTAKTSETSQIQADVNLQSERANSCKEFTFPDYAKIKNTATKDVVEFPCSACYEVNDKNTRKFSYENDNRQKNQRPSDFKHARYSSSTGERKELCPKILLKPGHSQHTANEKTSSSSQDNFGNVKQSEFGQNKTSSALISKVSWNEVYTSPVEVHRSSTSKCPSIPVTSQQNATPNKNNARQTSNNTKFTECNDSSVTSHKIVNKAADHNKETVGFASTQQSESLSKTGATSIAEVSEFVPFMTTEKLDSPKTQTLSYSKASLFVPPVTSHSRLSSTIPDQGRQPKYYESVSSSNESTVPRTEHTYIGVNEVVEPPRKSILKTKRNLTSGFYPVVRDSNTESIFQSLNAKPLQARISGKYTHEQSTTGVSGVNDTKPQYSLRNFTCKLGTPPKDKRFKPANNNLIYHNQWIECSSQIVYGLKRALVCSDQTADVSSSSRYVQFRDVKIKNDYLHFKMKCIQTGNVSILIRIGNFTFIKDLYVSFNPCSCLLSNMTMEKINPVENEFVFRLFIFDVFGEPVPSNSTATLKIDASFQSDDTKVVNKVKHIEQGQVCYDITVSGNRPWSRDLIVLLNGEQVDHAQEFEFTDKECNAINYLDDEDYEWIEHFFEEGDCGIFIPLTTGNDDGVFVAYNEDDCKLQSQNAKDYQLICKDVRKRDILGEGHAHINNIKRVLEIKDFVEIEKSGSHAVIHLKNVKSPLRPKCKQVVQHLLRGLYYRRKASEAARIRMEWKNRLISIDEILLSSKQEQSFVLCKYFKEFFGNLLNQYNREACDELFKFFNFHRDGSEVDLHGLLVADEKKLESLRLNLLIGSLSPDQIEEILERCRIYSKRGRERQTFRKKFREGKVPEDLVKRFVRDGQFMNENSSDGSEHECFDEDCGRCFEDDDSEYYDNDLESLRSYGCKDDVDAIIRRCRKEGDEAIRKLKETLDKFDVEEAIFNGTPWLEVIVGAGEHSRNNEQKIRPKVEKLLKERNLKFVPANKGSLVVTFKPYDGPEPCFGEYYCEKCNRCWKSSKSYIKKYQGCASCKAKCWPFKQREKGKVANYCREGSRSVKGQSLSHQSSLCQKCQELGRHCNEDDSYDSDY